MARNLVLLISALLLGTSFAQDPVGAPEAASSPTPTPLPSATPKIQPAAPGNADKREQQELRKLVDRLPPAQREAFRKNLDRWHKLSPAERAQLRNELDVRRKRMLHDIEEAARQAGLGSNDPRRPEFARRYTQERKAIEETLRKEMDAKRKAMIPELIERLKQEFASQPASVPATATAAPSSTPATPVSE